MTESGPADVDGSAVRPSPDTAPFSDLDLSGDRPSALGKLLAPWLERLKPIERFVDAILDRVRRHPVLGEIYEVIDGVFIDYGRDHGAMYAGALTFYGILSLIPLTVLFASVFGFVMSTVGGGDVGATLDDVVAQLRKVLPYLGPTFTDDLRTVVEYRSRLGVFGFVALLWAAAEVFRGVEFATARIFARVDDHAAPTHEKTAARSVITTKLLFGAVATAVVMAVMVLQMLTTMWRGVINLLDLPPWLASVLGDPLREGSPPGILMTAFTIVIGFVIVIQVFSPHRVMKRFSLLGGLLFLIFFEGAHAIYDLYLARITNISAMYGSFATLIVLILWIYYCAMLLLICCHAVKVAQRRFTIGPRWPKDGKLLVVA